MNNGICHQCILEMICQNSENTSRLHGRVRHTCASHSAHKLHSEIDLMITDIAMDYEMSGIQLVETALALRPDLKVIYSSGLSDEALSAKSSALGSVRLLRKPYMQAEFTESVRQVMKVNGTEPTCTGQAPTRP